MQTTFYFSCYREIVSQAEYPLSSYSLCYWKITLWKLFLIEKEEQIKPHINAMTHGKQIKVSCYGLSFQASGYESYC